MSKLLDSLAVSALLATGCGSLNGPTHPSDLPLRYHNAQYDFTFFLPVSWKGYSVLLQEWTPAYSAVPEQGPMIVLRHPHSNVTDPYHDIRILVFTRSQWEADMQGRLSYGAGGVEFELAHNARYVIATHSRSWADELKGWEEAERAVERNQGFNRPHLYAQ